MLCQVDGRHWLSLQGQARILDDEASVADAVRRYAARYREPRPNPERVVIDLSASHIWDASTVASLDAITTKYERKGKTVEITGLNLASAERHGRLTGQLPAH